MIDTSVTMNHVIILIIILFFLIGIMFGYKIHYILYGDGRLERERNMLRFKLARLQRKLDKMKKGKGLVDDDIFVGEMD